MTDPDDAYLMANLRPADTGLPMVIWLSERGSAPAQYGARVLVSREHGDRMEFNNAASVSVGPPSFRPAASPYLTSGLGLSVADLEIVSRWIVINSDAIVAYWDGEIGTDELVKRLRGL